MEQSDRTFQSQRDSGLGPYPTPWEPERVSLGLRFITDRVLGIIPALEFTWGDPV